MRRGIAVVARIGVTFGCAGVLLTAAGQTPAQQAPAQPQAPRPTPSFRTDVDVVSLSVTVAETTAGAPRYVTDLGLADFEVFEDGVKQDVTVFNKTNSPIALALLIDSSASMDAQMSTAQEAAIGFTRTLRAQDIAEVIDFDDRAILGQTFTNDHALLERAIRRTSAGGSTALYNALYIAMTEFKKLKKTDIDLEQPRRQAVVVLSDGENTNDLFSFDDIMNEIKRAQTAVYTIAIRDPNEPESKSWNQARFVLRSFAQETGGRSFFPKHPNDLNSVYGEIADELSSQYAIGYTSKNSRRDGAWRRIVVRVNRPNVTTRTKLGYFASKG